MEQTSPVFIVEDDPLMSRMYERIFKLSNYQTELAGNGEEALQKLATITPSVILLDVMMPKMNGFEVLSALKKDERLKSVPVVILSNLTGQEDAKKAVEMGAAKYLIKSDHTPKEVVEEIAQIIGKK